MSIMDPVVDGGWGTSSFYELSKLRDSSVNLIRIKCEVVYNGDAVYVDSTKMTENMIGLLDSAKHADVTFLVGKEKIKAHKAILAAQSNYFDKMFDSGMRECAKNEVEIHDAEPSEFKELLRFLYSGLTPENLPEIALSLLPLANRYEAMELKDMCVEAIRCSLSANELQK